MSFVKVLINAMAELNIILRKSLLLAFAGQQLIGLADVLYNVTRALRSETVAPTGRKYLYELLVFPGVDVWEAYYRDPRKLMWDFCTSLLKANGVDDSEIDEALVEMGNAGSWLEAIETLYSDAQQKDREALREAGNEILSGLLEFVDLATADLRDQMARVTDPHREGEVLGFVRDPAVKFMARVFAPCLASYHVLPGDLLEKAAHGCKNALGDLLSLDKHALFFPEIATLFHSRVATDFKGFRTSIPDFLKKSLPMPAKSKLKQTAGALLWIMFANLKEHIQASDDATIIDKYKRPNSLSQREVLELAAEYGYATGQLRFPQPDPDIGDGDAFKQAVQRLRPGLTSLLGRIMPIASKSSASASPTPKPPKPGKQSDRV